MLSKSCLSMANDGCQLPPWTGQAFAYLPHHPRGRTLSSQSYAQQRPQGESRQHVSLDGQQCSKRAYPDRGARCRRHVLSLQARRLRMQ